MTEAEVWGHVATNQEMPRIASQGQEEAIKYSALQREHGSANTLIWGFQPPEVQEDIVVSITIIITPQVEVY